MYWTGTNRGLCCLLGTGIVCPSSYGIYSLYKDYPPTSYSTTLSSNSYVKEVATIRTPDNESNFVDRKKYSGHSFIGRWLDNQDNSEIKKEISFLNPENKNKTLWENLWKKVKVRFVFTEGSDMDKFMSSIKTGFDKSGKSPSSLNGKCSEWYFSGVDHYQKNIRDHFFIPFCSVAAVEASEQH